MEIKQSGNSHSGPSTNTSTSAGKKTDASQSPASGKASSPQEATESSTVTVTDSALKLLKIESTLAGISSFDSEKVERIKQALSDGSYAVNTDRIAQKLLAFEQGLA